MTQHLLFENSPVPSAKAQRLSPSSLNLFLDCPRCFWLEKVKFVKRPRGIFPSLPGGMDRVIKTHFDAFRAQGKLPPELPVDEFKGIKLFNDQALLEKWRDWRTGLACDVGENGVLFGALDDLLVAGDRYVPFDYKTKGSPTSAEDAIRYYQNQLDCYALMLEGNDRPSAGFAYLLYYSPKTVFEAGQVTFTVQPLRIQTDTERARETCARALSLLAGPMPRPREACEYCTWLQKSRPYSL